MKEINMTDKEHIAYLEGQLYILQEKYDERVYYISQITPKYRELLEENKQLKEKLNTND